ncbi:hypothetical protein [Enterocloster sp.]
MLRQNTDLIPAYCDLGQYKGDISIPIAGETQFLIQVDCLRNTARSHDHG